MVFGGVAERAELAREEVVQERKWELPVAV